MLCNRPENGDNVNITAYKSYCYHFNSQVYIMPVFCSRKNPPRVAGIGTTPPPPPNPHPPPANNRETETNRNDAIFHPWTNSSVQIC